MVEMPDGTTFRISTTGVLYSLFQMAAFNGAVSLVLVFGYLFFNGIIENFFPHHYYNAVR